MGVKSWWKYDSIARLSELLEKSCRVSNEIVSESKFLNPDSILVSLLIWSLVARLCVTLAYWKNRLMRFFFLAEIPDWCWIQPVLSVIALLGLNFRTVILLQWHVASCMWIRKRCLDTVQWLEIPDLTLDMTGQPQQNTSCKSNSEATANKMVTRKIVFLHTHAHV